MPKGLGLRKQEVSWTELIPGLPVEVKGDTNANGQLAASQILFTKDSLQTASMIQAGLTPTSKEVQANQQNIATNKEDIATNQQAISSNQQAIASNQQQIASNQQEVEQRFADLADYNTTSAAMVYFQPGSSTLAANDKAALSTLAATALGIPGYIVQVKGFADSTGNAAMNQKLSRDRAEAVIEYLMQVGKIPPRHIVAPGAMGISDPVASNETSQGRADNRRVEVKVLVNKGISNFATQ
jgi:outer membrane protein OmpA-like peptidoglycan-associated protein